MGEIVTGVFIVELKNLSYNRLSQPSPCNYTWEYFEVFKSQKT
jgi:hypothetical protein